MQSNPEEIEYIEHHGKVVGVDPHRGLIEVSIADSDDCGACPAAKVCGSLSNGGKTIVDVPVKNPCAFVKGQPVTLRGSERLHRKAIVLATVIPSLLLIGIMTGIFILTGNQLTACLCGLGAMIAFFIVLYLIRNHLSTEFQFEVVK